MRSVLNTIPLADSVKAHFNGCAPWLDFVVDHPDTSDPFYDMMKCGEALERANIPVFLVSGWQDLFIKQNIEQYLRLNECGTHVALLIGPWTHMQLGMDARTHRQSYDWLEEHVATRRHQARKPGVQYFVTGAKVWRDVPKWPPPTIPEILYLGESNRLSCERSSAEKSSSTFTFEYKQPTPTIGGNLLLGGGNLDDTVLASRPDVLSFTTEPLVKDLEIVGNITVELVHSCSALNMDLAVRVSEVNVRGRSHLITETYQRFRSRKGTDEVVLQLDHCAHRFTKGHQIRLYLAGASHPRYASTQENAVHTIHHGKTEASRVLLPVTA